MGGGRSRADLVPGIVIAASVCFLCVYQGHSIYQEMTLVSEVGWKCRFQVCPLHCPPSPDVDTDSVFLGLPWSLPPHTSLYSLGLRRVSQCPGGSSGFSGSWVPMSLARGGDTLTRKAAGAWERADMALIAWLPSVAN